MVEQDEEKMKMARGKKNVVVFPFMAQGHIIPFLSLSLHLLSKHDDLTITFLNTPLNIASLRSSLSHTFLSAAIRFVELPFRSSYHSLPPDVENTDVLPYPLVVRLLQASTSLEPSFRGFLQGLIAAGEKPLCVIADIFFGWTATVSRDLGIFHAVFSGASGFGLACYYSIWRSLPHRRSDGSIADEFALEDFEEAGTIHVSQLPLTILEANGSDSWSVFQGENLPAWANSNGILFNTVEEFDSVGFAYFRRKLGVEVWPVGPVLLPPSSRPSVPKQQGASSETVKDWLSTKSPRSVLYVSFGSMNTISASHMMQLAIALESSGRDFIWVVRPPMGHDINSEFDADKWLPKGFEQRVAVELRKGLLIRKWAPQAEILAHEATSAFLTHCGWNSVLEALSNGVPLLGWPMSAEQFFNAKLLEEGVGVCVEVVRGKSCEARHEEIRDKFEMVMGENERGEEMRRRARRVKEVIERAMGDGDGDGGEKGSSLKALEGFFEAATAAWDRDRSEDGEKTKKKENGVLV